MLVASNYTLAMGYDRRRGESVLVNDGRRGEFAAKLDAWRRELGLSGAAFARRFGRSRQWWWFVQHGRITVGGDTLRRILRERPELIYYLQRDLTVEEVSSPQTTRAEGR